MKNKTRLLVVLGLFLTNFAFTQDEFYYTFDYEKEPLITVSGEYLVHFTHGTTTPYTSGIELVTNIYVTTDTTDINSYASNYYITPAYITSQGRKLYEINQVVLQFKKNVNSVTKNNIISTYGLQHIKTTSVYELYTTENALQKSKQIYQTGYVKYCTPNFMINIQKSHIPNDEYFTKQFYLYNTGQIINDGNSGTNGADIDATKAWDITKGDSSIIIAVIDEGVSPNHPDLPNSRQVILNGSNFAAQFDGTDVNIPSPVLDTFCGNNHGNACAGIIAATQDNNIGISGIAPNCRIMPVRIPFGFSVSSNVYADAIEFAHDNGADIISNSWGSPSSSADPVIATSIDYAINGGSVVVFSAGNTANHLISNDGFVTSPANANIYELITVGASDRNDSLANYSPKNELIDITAPSHKAYNGQIASESFEVWTIDIPNDFGYNKWRDCHSSTILPSLGEFLPSTGSNPLDYTGRMGGTSAAAPQAAGVAALMLSVNPCLSPRQVKEILINTTDKVGGYNYNQNTDKEGHSLELGYGRLNAHQAVIQAQNFYSATLDLYMRDRLDDIGTDSGYVWGLPMDDSPDVWVRNQDDGLTNQQHESPEYSTSSPVYVYVRVGNKSCVPSTGTEQVALYWSKVASVSSWPINWNGSDPTIGAPIGSIIIPVLQPGEDTILKFTWTIPNPNIFNNWNTCLLTRILAPATDPISSYPNQLGQEVYYNNNISMRNLVIVDNNPNIAPPGVIQGVYYPHGTHLYVGNPSEEEDDFDFRFKVPENHQGNPITGEAEVKVIFDNEGWSIFQSALEQNSHIEILREKEVLLLSSSIELNNITFPANKRVPIYIGFSFLSDEINPNDQIEFGYHILQKYSDDDPILGDNWIGGVHFKIRRQDRDGFDADAGPDKEIYKNDNVTIYANQIGEAAIYNWYNSEGELIYTGQNLIVSPDVTAEYELEVIALSDGVKDYDDVEITVKNGRINNISPNPATQQITVEYETESTGSAYLMILGTNNFSASNNYLLDTNLPQTTIDISAYPTGLYTVALICDGQIVDAQALIVQ